MARRRRPQVPQRLPRSLHIRRQPGELSLARRADLGVHAPPVITLLLPRRNIPRPQPRATASPQPQPPRPHPAPAPACAQVLNLLGLRHLTMDTHLVRANPGSELYQRHARMTRCLPQFLVIGTQKGGTSSFHFLLKSGWHDDVQARPPHRLAGRRGKWDKARPRIREVGTHPSRPADTPASLHRHTPPYLSFPPPPRRSTMGRRRSTTSAGTTSSAKVLWSTSSDSTALASGWASARRRARCAAR